MIGSASSYKKDKNPPPFLPDFCQWRFIGSGLLLAQLLAIVLMLSPTDGQRDWTTLLNISLFTHLVMLSCALVLCLSRSWLEKQSKFLAATVSYVLVLIITLFYSHFAWEIMVDPVIEIPSQQLLRMKDIGITIHVQEGDGSILPSKYAWFMLRNLAISMIVGAIALRYFYLSYHWKRTTQEEADFRVQALQARINPHFLFNSMNTIAMLTHVDANLAERAILDLAELFRASLGDAKNRVPLSEELTLCKQYLNIEGFRLGNRLKVQWILDTIPPDALVPKLSLQPLLENAIYYGIQPLPEGGTICVTGLTDGHFIKIDIDNPLPPPNSQPIQRGSGYHIAIDNLRQRLAVFYGKRARLELFSDGQFYRVSLRFPYEYREKHENPHSR
jgi:two-component system, LytTR family, sensor histidine kinase AlgZ